MKRPNLFIVGAPKCGTTSFYHYLGDHPQIFMSPEKEPDYFAFENTKRWFTSEKKYLDLYAEADERHRAVGEASTHYLRSKRAVDEIRAFAPEARIIVFLRDPIEIVRSFHNTRYYHGGEREGDLQRAWNASSEAASREGIANDYREVGLNGKHLARWYTIFPREQVKVILLEDVRADIAAVYRELLTFLGCDDDGRAEFPRFNEFRAHRSPLLGGLLRSKLVRHIGFWRRRLIGKHFGGMVAPLLRANATPAPRIPLSAGFHEQLAAEFYKDVRLLERLLGRDLGHWLRRRGE